MSTTQGSGDRATIQCPICAGTGRLYPDSLDCTEDSNGTKCVGISGIDCPSCEGQAKL